MSIYIKDETAGRLVLTIDNNGNMAFADGTPISLLSLNGYGIIDSDGYIVHGLGSNSAYPGSGIVHVPTNEIVSVATLAGRIPIVQLTTTWPAVLCNSDPDSPGRNTYTYTIEPNHKAEPFSGVFFIECNTSALDGSLLNPSSPNYDPTLAAGTDCPYKWM